MSSPKPPFDSRAAASSAYAEHVSRGEVAQARRYEMDLVMGAREGAVFWDAFSGKRYVDCYTGGGIHILGHRHPAVLEAVKDTLDTLDVGDPRLISGLRAELARRLAATTGGALTGVIFGVGGSEAVDVAINAVRATTKRPRIVSIRGGSYGHSGLALAAGDAGYREPFGLSVPGFVQVPWGDLDALDAAIDDRTAALLVEPLPTALGMALPPRGYLEDAAELVKARGAKLIVDEVYCGLGRTGRLWSYQHHAVTPDVVVTGGGLGGGLYPISAALMTREVHKVFDDHPYLHVSTFGGAEPGCAAALAVLEVIEAPGFLQRVAAAGARVERGLEGLPFDIQGRGLALGFKIGTMDAGMLLTKMLYDDGVFCAHAPSDPSALLFMPPLTIEDATIDDVLPRLRGVFAPQ